MHCSALLPPYSVTQHLIIFVFTISFYAFISLLFNAWLFPWVAGYFAESAYFIQFIYLQAIEPKSKSFLQINISFLGRSECIAQIRWEIIYRTCKLITVTKWLSGRICPDGFKYTSAIVFSFLLQISCKCASIFTMSPWNMQHYSLINYFSRSHMTKYRKISYNRVIIIAKMSQCTAAL